jgi:hypothetical protein
VKLLEQLVFVTITIPIGLLGKPNIENVNKVGLPIPWEEPS